MEISNKIKNIHELRKQLLAAEITLRNESALEFELICTNSSVPFEKMGNSLFANNLIYHSNEKGHIIAKNMIGNGYLNMRTYLSDNGELPYLISFVLKQVIKDYEQKGNT